MTLSDESLDVYHRQHAENSKSAPVFEQTRSFVYTSFINSILQAFLSLFFFVIVTIITAYFYITLIKGAIDSFNGYVFNWTELPLGPYIDFTWSFLIMFYLQREERIRESRWGSREAYFRLRIVSLYRMMSKNSYSRRRYHYWYSHGQLNYLWVIDLINSIAVYLPAYVSASTAAADTTNSNQVRFLMMFVATISGISMIAAQLTWLHQLSLLFITRYCGWVEIGGEDQGEPEPDLPEEEGEQRAAGVGAAAVPADGSINANGDHGDFQVMGGDLRFGDGQNGMEGVAGQ